MIGIKYRKIVKGRGEVRIQRQQLFKAIASCAVLLKTKLNHPKLHQRGNALLLLDKSAELFNGLLRPASRRIELSEQHVRAFKLRVQFNRLQQI